ncbi:MAG TPA: glutamate racemase [Candidatus Angelobacter sp.]|jgi:glutamate racemase|nr:glutamate racemase [Candidatus Angelobacter sp.]
MPPVIGVFDSGFGGLTVLQELRKALPAADYLYFGDTAHLPYGAKSVRTVAKYAISAANFLEEHGIEMLVIACNTATALAFDEIRAAVKVPVVGVIEPGAERAASISKTKKVVVAATEATVASHAYQRALKLYGMQATEKACPLFVPLVEEGWVDHRVTEQVAHIYMDEVFRYGARDADVLVLGCTHYPLIRSLLRRVVPQSVEIVDSAESTAAKVVEILGENRGQGTRGDLRCYATDSVEKFRRLGSKFLGSPIEKIELVDIEK